MIESLKKEVVYLRNELKSNGVDNLSKGVDETLESDSEESSFDSLKKLNFEKKDEDLLSAHMELLNKYKYLEVG